MIAKGGFTPVVFALIKRIAINLARPHNYKNEEYYDIIDEYAHLTIEAMDQFEFDNNDQMEVLMLIKQDCAYLIQNDEQMI